jgi:sensor histidine kinase YesM
MNGIAGLLRENRNEEAAAMLSGLSDLLQRVLNDSGRQLVPLGEEVEFLESYLNIQRMRFGDRLRVTLNAPDELLSAQIPPLILQPLVENAIVHGVGRRIEGGRISVTVKEDKGTLSLSVANDGPPLNAYTPGVGVSNTRRRLERLYGHDYGFDLRNRDADSVEAVIRVPYRTVTS